MQEKHKQTNKSLFFATIVILSLYLWKWYVTIRGLHSIIKKKNVYWCVGLNIMTAKKTILVELQTLFF